MDNVVTAIPLEGPVLVWDDASETPERLVVAIADMMSAIGGGNIFRQADMAVVLSPQHAEVFARAGLSRADVHAMLISRAGRRLGDIKRGGIWRGAAGATRVGWGTAGSSRQKREPPPGASSTQRRPCCASANRRATASPRPEPGTCGAPARTTR